MENLLSWLFFFGILAIFLIIKFYLPHKLKADIDAIKEKEIAGFKSKLEKELEDTKHQLQLDYAKQNIVFEHQKESFKNILKAMTYAIEAIDNEFDKHELIFNPIEFNVWINFNNKLREELLFLDKSCLFATDLYKDIIYEAVILPEQSKFPKSNQIKKAYNELCYLTGRFLHHFHYKIGLSANPDDLLPDFETLKKELKEKIK